MSVRRQIIRAVTTGTMTQAQAARAYGVSASWVSKLLRQWTREGHNAYYPKSRRPHSHPATVPDWVIKRITTLRRHLASEGLDAGPATIRDHLLNQIPHTDTPSRATIARILTRQGLTTPEPKKRPKTSLTRFEADLPNGCWQSDFTHIPLADGTHSEVITWLDDHSRLVLHLSAHHRITVNTVVATFTNASTPQKRPHPTPPTSPNPKTHPPHNPKTPHDSDATASTTKAKSPCATTPASTPSE